MCVTTQMGSPVDAVTSSIAEAIRREMGAQEISAPTLARRIGMSAQGLRNYIRKGQERVMPVTALVQIADGLGLTVEVLWERARVIREQPWK